MSRYIQSSRKIPPFYLVEKQDIFGSGAFQVFYQSCNWVPPAPKIRVRVVGAGGGADCNAGGGGGGFSIGCFDVDPSTTYAITVGAGVDAAQGGTSSFSSLISATGGGYSPNQYWLCCCSKGGCGIGGFCNTCGGQGGIGANAGGAAAGSWIGNGGHGSSGNCLCGEIYGAGGSVGCATANAEFGCSSTQNTAQAPITINYITSYSRFPFDSFGTFTVAPLSVSRGMQLPLPGIGSTPGATRCTGGTWDSTSAGIGGGGTAQTCGTGAGKWGGGRPGLGGGSGAATGANNEASYCGSNRLPGGNGVVVVEW